ncbi:MAG: PKD domain-containing protein [Flavisolibacter sp.]
MKRQLSILLALSVTLTATIVLSCKKETSREGLILANQPPVAIAGSDVIIILPVDSARLNGTASSDADGLIKKWQWSKISGPLSFFIQQKDSGSTLVNALVQGTYQFELAVTDDKGDLGKDTIQIIVSTNSGNNLPRLHVQARIKSSICLLTPRYWTAVVQVTRTIT